MKSVFSRDLCVGENTLREACVEQSAESGHMRRKAQRSPLPQKPNGFWGSLNSPAK